MQSINNFHLNGDRVLIEIEENTQQEFKILASQREKPTMGKVILVGNGLMGEEGKKCSMPVQIGDTVFFTQWSGATINISNREYVCLKINDIIGYWRN